MQARYGLPDIALLDMGDFAGGLLKYLRDHPVPRLTIAGGFAKLTKLAQGALDLHSSRSEVDRAFLAGLARGAGARELLSRIVAANTAARSAGDRRRRAASPLADAGGARSARATARGVLAGAPVAVGRAGRRPRRRDPGGDAAMARLLILGGTAEAAELAARLAGDDRLETVTSLAGLTRLPSAPSGRMRRGGFGGPDGLAAFLREERLRRADRRHASLRRRGSRAMRRRRRRWPACRA